MGDEIAQVVKLEVDTAVLVVKATIKTAEFILRCLKAIFGKVNDIRLSFDGEKSVKDIFAISKDGPPQVVNIPTEGRDDVLKKLKDAGVHFSILPDFDATDGMSPILIPVHEMSICSGVVKNYMDSKITESEQIIRQYDKQIGELKEKMIGAAPEDRAKLAVQVENLEQAKNEALDIRNASEILAKGEANMTLEDYFKTGKMTEFERDPDLAIYLYNEGGEIGKTFPASECFQPVRDQGMYPATGCKIYLPGKDGDGVTVTRNFFMDDNNVVYSEYTFKNKMGEIYCYSDMGMTKADWNEKILPELLDNAGILKDDRLKIFSEESRLRAYQNAMKLFQERENKKAEEENKQEHTDKKNEEVKKNDSSRSEKAESNETSMSKEELEQMMNEKLKGMANADYSAGAVLYSVPADALSREDGSLVFRMDGMAYHFTAVQSGEMKGGMINFTLDKTQTITVYNETDTKSEPYKITPKDLADTIQSRREAFQETARNFAEGKGR